MNESSDKPNWNFTHFNLGDKFEWVHTITAEDVDGFCKLSGDTNPLHLDSDFARRMGYKDRVVYGALSMAYISHIIGVHFPGPGTVWLSQRLRFESPLYIGDTIIVVVIVKQKNESLRALSLEIEVTKINDRRAIQGEIVVARQLSEKSSKALDGEAVVSIPVRPTKIETMGHVAIVTGSGRGIGAAIAEDLASEGIKVVINYLSNEDTARTTTQKIINRGGEAFMFQADVSKPEGSRSLFQEAIKKFGRVDVIVNNAGPVIQKKDFLKLNFQDFTAFFEAYVGSTFELVRLAAPGMRDKAFGRVINILSSAIIGVPPIGWTPYVVAKSALMELSRCMAIELAPWGITTNMVSPAMVPTDQWFTLSENQLRAMSLRNPTRRLTQVEDVSRTVVFLTRPEAQHVNGVNIPVTGGETLL